MLSIEDDKNQPSNVKSVAGDVLFYGGITMVGLIIASLSTVPAGAGLAFLIAMPLAWLYHMMPGAAWALVGLAFIAMLVSFSVSGWYYVLLLSKMGGERRPAAAWLLAITSVLVWMPLVVIAVISTFNVPGLSITSNLAGLLVPISMVSGLIAQIYAALFINGKVAAPVPLKMLSPNVSQAQTSSATAIGAAKAEQFTIQLQAVKATKDLDQLNAQALECLKTCQLSAAELRSGEADPVPVLLSLLVKQKRHDDAEEISRHFLHVIEHHSS